MAPRPLFPFRDLTPGKSMLIPAGVTTPDRLAKLCYHYRGLLPYDYRQTMRRDGTFVVTCEEKTAASQPRTGATIVDTSALDDRAKPWLDRARVAAAAEAWSRSGLTVEAYIEKHPEADLLLRKTNRW